VQSEELLLDRQGKNTLYPLLNGFSKCAVVIEDVGAASEEALLRPIDRVARYHFFSGVQKVPFLHIHPVRDLADDCVGRITSLLRDVPRILNSANLLGVRNRIPHGGGEFPSQEDFMSVLAALEHTVRALETSGLSPTVHHFSAGKLDQYGRYSAVLRDYASREVALLLPSALRYCGLPGPSDVQVVFHWASIRGSSECLRFSVEEDSPYARMWRDFRVPEDGFDSPSVLTAKEGSAAPR
jgi:hypothetical protein